ncbi:cytochrome C [Dyella choica]|uniref:Cytochrome C n=1 Tax=Dyella choica TaxID=1927959 RepID=A0A432M168_9GAMM|nr:cytochrome C [Dyella choica]RUL70916.1 cytochrome C [Dyella choica]
MQTYLHRHAPCRPRKLHLWYGLAALPLLAVQTAQAVPAYARQTGSACADCHAGAYGPALTPYGMRFKMNGYTDTNGQGTKIPLAVQINGRRIVPAKGQSSNLLSEADIYLAGRVTDHVGGFVKVADYNNGQDKFITQLNDLDLRFVAKDLNLGGKEALIGVSVNNSPGFTDPVDALPANTLNGPPTVSGTLLNPSSANNLSHRVIGATVYTLYDKNWYGELGTYNSLPVSTQYDLGYTRSGDPGRFSNTVYARFAYMRDFKRQFVSAGLVGLTTMRQRPRSGPSEHLTDLGYDVTYQYLGNHENIVQFAYVNIMERRRYATTPLGPLPGQVAQPRGVVHDQTLTLTYVFKQSYGVTIAHMVSTGTHDIVRFVPYGQPETSSNSFTVFWTPFGKDDSFTSIANLRLAAEWFRFNKFNGSSSNVFGAPPGAPATNARDLNAFLLFASVAF